MIRNSERNNRISYRTRADRRLSGHDRGFTLVELLVVLVMLAIVAAIGIPALIGFIEKGKESEYKAHAEAALAATQAALSDLYNDAGNSFTPTKRNNVKELVKAADGTAFTVWTEKVLWDGKTKALEENIGSYTIVKAIYKENDSAFMYYDGANWTRYDNEIDAKIAAVGSFIDPSGNKVNNELGNNVIFVWPYKRDFAYLDNITDPLTQRTEADDPNIKIVTFETDPAYSGVYYFHRIGKGVSTGKDSVKVVFWKENNIIKSSWDDVEGIYEESQDYKYKFFPDKEGINFLGWKPSQDAGYSYTNSEQVGNYIFGEGQGTDPNGTPVNEFTFYAALENDENFVEDAIVSRKLSDLIGSGNQMITSFTRVPMASMGSNVTAIEEAGSTPIYAWIEGNTVKWCTKANEAYMPADCSGFFTGNGNLSEFSFGGFNPGHITDMSNMFSGCTGLQAVNIDGETGELTAASGMFNGCTSLTSVGLANIKSGNVTNFENMFYGCSSLVTADVAFDTSSSQSFKNMFNGCGNIKSLNLSSWNTSQLTDGGLGGTFSGCTSLATLDMSGWDMTGLSNLDDTFNGLVSLATLNMSGWDLSNCISLNRTFKDCSSLTGINISEMGLSDSLTSMSETFAGCTSFSRIDFSGFTFKNVTDVSGLLNMGSRSSSLTKVIFDADTDTTSITNMSNMFAGCDSIKTLDLTKFNTASVTNFEGMFNNMPNVETITVSTKFVVADTTKTMFIGDVKLSGGKTSYVGTNENPLSQYAKIDGWRKQEGYFEGIFNETVLSKRLFQALFPKDTETTNVEMVSTGSKTLAELEGQPDVYKRVDIGAENSNNDSGFYIYAWREGSIVKWWTDADKAYMPGDCSSFFKGNTKLLKFDFSGFDVSRITNMQEMFSECTGITDIVFGDYFDEAKVTNLKSTFNKCSSMKKYDLSNWNMRSITNMESSFINNTALETIVLGNDCKLDACTNLMKTFNKCSKLKTDVGSLDPKMITTLYGTFTDCSGLTKLSLNTWNVSNVNTLHETFKNCTNLTTLDIDSWETGDVTTMQSTFEACSKIKTLDIGNWDVSNVQTLLYTFKNCTALTTLNIGEWKTGKVKTLESTFESCKNLTTFELDKWDVANVTSLKATFKECDKATHISVKNWQVQKVTDAETVFNNCDNLLYIDFGDGWHLNNCEKLIDAFARCYKINQDFSNIYTTDKLYDIRSMFKASACIEKLDLRNVNVSGVSCFEQAFRQEYKDGRTSALVEINLSGWDFSSAENCLSMFYDCKELKTIYATNDFDCSSIPNSKRGSMFTSCSKIVGGNGTTYHGDSYTNAKIDRDGVTGYFTLGSTD